MARLGRQTAAYRALRRRRHPFGASRRFAALCRATQRPAKRPPRLVAWPRQHLVLRLPTVVRVVAPRAAISFAPPPPRSSSVLLSPSPYRPYGSSSSFFVRQERCRHAADTDADNGAHEHTPPRERFSREESAAPAAARQSLARYAVHAFRPPVCPVSPVFQPVQCTTAKPLPAGAAPRHYPLCPFHPAAKKPKSQYSVRWLRYIALQSEPIACERYAEEDAATPVDRCATIVRLFSR